MEKIKELCKQYPNDADLGKNVRAFVNAEEEKRVEVYIGLVVVSALMTAFAVIVDQALEEVASGKKKKKHKKQ
jgi:hypothetical protein